MDDEQDGNGMRSKMKNYPTIEKIREVRHRISEEVQHDPRKLVERYMKLQQKHQSRLLQKDKQHERLTDLEAA